MPKAGRIDNTVLLFGGWDTYLGVEELRVERITAKTAIIKPSPFHPPFSA